MTLFATPLVLLGLTFPAVSDTVSSDPAELAEQLQDRQAPRLQSQAALLLVQSSDPAAEEIIRKGLRQTDNPDVFQALAAAIRTLQDQRFNEELIDTLIACPLAQRAVLRRAAAEALAVVCDARSLQKLQKLAEDSRTDAATRQTVLWILGQSGRKQVVPVLLELLGSEHEAVQGWAAEALADLTGIDLGTDRARWRAWWARHKDLTAERWLERRLAYQASRANRLAGELERARAQVSRLHQQLYSRLPPADRPAHVQSVLDDEDPAVRRLAVQWIVELLSVPAEPARAGNQEAQTRRTLGEALLRLSHDGEPEVQRSAVLALGRLDDWLSYQRLRTLLRQGRASVRAAAARALAMQARGPANDPAVQARRKQVVPLLQKALDDPALEVVLEAAEDLGALGVPEAGPVLCGLLRHSSPQVRQTSAQALERVADAAVLDSLLAGLDDPAVGVRFSLVGAIGRAAATLVRGGTRPDPRERLLTRLETLLSRDPDPGVRSRAATVVGEHGSAANLPALWKRVQAVEDSRVQEKAWAALVEIVTRSASLDLLREWDRTLGQAENGGPHRLRLLTEVHSRWDKRDETRPQAAAAVLLLVPAQLDQGKWKSALPFLRELRARTGLTAEDRRRVLNWSVTAARQGIKDATPAARVDALRWIKEVRATLSRNDPLDAELEAMEKP